MGHTTKTVGCAMAAALLAWGCGSSSDGNGSMDSGGSGSDREPIDVAAISASLQAVDSCEDLLGEIQRDAIAKLDLAIAHYEASPNQGFPVGPGGITVTPDGVAVPGVAPPRGPIAAPQPGMAAAFGNADNSIGIAETTGGAAGAGAPAGPSGFSGTNNQVADVDEADFVKVANEGERLYVLHGSQLFGIDAWPAAEMSMYGEPADIEGWTSEMFVHEGKAVVFSNIEDYDGTRFEGPSDEQPFSYRYRPFTKVTVLDVETDTPSVLRELYYEGNYTSSRRHDSIVRIVLQATNEHAGLFYPDVEPFDAWGRPYDDEVLAEQLEQWRKRTISSIENTELSDWIPDTYERDGNAYVKLDPDCASYYTPSAGAADWGLTRIVGIDMSAPETNIAGTTVMGGASIVYANTDTMVLAQPDYRSLQFDFGLTDGEQTALHRFEISGAASNYQASGWVPGHPLDQFSIDATEEAVFVSTTGWERVDPDAARDSEDFWRTEPVNQVLALRTEGDALEVASSTGPIGHERETIHSTRFVGDRAYVVTFERTDPLIVVDRSDPDALMPLGEVEIPGFSTYMHPLGDDHLLTIGQGADWGVQLQIFDVSDDLNPVRTHLLDYGNGSSSEAQWEHRAFNFYAEHDLLAVPMQSWGPIYQTGLDVLRVTIEDGFERLGMADHSELAQVHCEQWEDGFGEVYEECWTEGDSEVRRGVFIHDDTDTYVYSISWGGIMAHDLTDLETPLSIVDLPSPRYNDGFAVGGMVAAPPAISTPTPMASAGAAGAPAPEPDPEPAPEPQPEPEPEG